nr:adhesin [Haemophilus influenzae]
METSGHHLSIDDNAIVKTKEWLLDPDTVTIEEPSISRNNAGIDNEFPLGQGTEEDPKRNNTKTILTNTTISSFLKNAKVINITASNKITVNSTINVEGDSHLILWSEGKGGGGIAIKKDILIKNKEKGLNLTVYSGGWLDIYGNISVGKLGNINFKAGKDIAFEKGTNQTITGQGVITSGNEKGFRFENVTLNGTGRGLYFNLSRPGSNNGNIINHFNGTLNVSGIVNISMIAPDTKPWYNRHKGRTHWRLSYLNVSQDSKFTLAIDARGRRGGDGGPLAPNYDLNGISFTKDTTFNVGRNAKVDFDIKAAVGVINNHVNLNYALFNGNISVLGGGSVNFALDASSSTIQSPGVIINSNYINVSEGSNLTFKTEGSTKVGFSIKKDLTLNATGGNITLLQVEGTDGMIDRGIVAKKNITFEGGNITFGSKKAVTDIEGNVTINNNANVTLIGSNFDNHRKPLTIKKDVIINSGNLTAGGNVINIDGNLTVKNDAKFNGNTKDNLNITGTLTNNGTTEINITQGVVKLGDITNNGSLNITTHANSGQKSIISGDIINKKGDLNITDDQNNAEIQINGNISQKKGNLTISSDKINITKQIAIKKGVDGENSGSDAPNNANLTIKTKELKLTEDLNISSFDKAEITAKDGADLTIGDNGSAGNANAKKVIFDKVKNSKISAGDHNVTLNSKVETSGDSNNTEGGSDNNAGLTITAKNVEVNNNITSNKTVNITASAGNVTTKAGTTINATTGNVNITTQTGDIKGEVKSTSGNVNITASGNTLTVSNVTGQNVTVTASSGVVTTTAGSTINATTGNASITTNTGSINGKVESSSGSVTLTATGETLAVGNISGNTVTITADSGKLTTTEGTTINATTNTEISTKEGELKGEVKAEKGSVNITAKEGNLTVLNVTAKNDVTVKAEQGTLTTTSGGTIKSEERGVNLTAKSGEIKGNIEATKGAATVTASDGNLNVANITSKTATLTASKGTLTTKAGSAINGTESVTTSSQSGNIGGEISGNTVNVTANTGDLTVKGDANIKATDGAATLTASSGKLTTEASSSITSASDQVNLSSRDGSIAGSISAANVTLNTTGTLTTVTGSNIKATSGTLVINAKDADLNGEASGNHTVVNATNANGSGSVIATTSSRVNITGDLITINGLNIISKNGKNTVLLKGVEIDVKYIQPGIASVNEVIEAKRALEKVKDLSDEEREALAKLGVSAVRFVEPNNAITVDAQNEFATRPLSRIVISEGRACFSNSDGATVCVNIADNGR